MKLKLITGISMFLLMSSATVAVIAYRTPNPGSQVPVPSLPTNFTVVYSKSVKDVSSEAAKVKRLANVRSNYEPFVRDGTMSQQQFDRIMAGFTRQIEHPLTAEAVLVTLTGHSGVLLLDIDHPDVSQKDLILYDGKKCCTKRNAASAGGIGTMTIRQGFRSDWLSEFVLPGASLPYIPLMKALSKVGATTGTLQTYRGDVAILNQAGGSPDFFPGEIQMRMVGGLPQVESVFIKIDGKPYEKREYLKHKRVGKCWVASDILITKYESGDPIVIEHYSLVNALPASLPAAKYSITNWLEKGTVVTIDTPTGRISCDYDPNGGPLIKQAERQHMLQNTNH